MTRQESTCKIVKYGLCCNAECGRCSLDREAAIGPTHWVGADTVDFDRGNIPAFAQQPDVFTFELAAASGHKTFLVERRGDLLVHLAGGIELRNPLPQPIEIDVVPIRMNPSLQAMFADGAGLPRDLEPYLTPVALLIEDNLAYDKT